MDWSAYKNFSRYEFTCRCGCGRRPVAEFQIWDRTVLERFAAEASDRLREQRVQITDALAEQARLHAEIEALRADLRAAIDAYRALVTSSRPSSSQTS